MYAIVFMLGIALNVAPARPRLSMEPRVTCGITTVGYRFIGSPGQQFAYAGDVYRVPKSGWIELISDAAISTYRAAGRELPLNLAPADEFGFRPIRLPKETP